MAALLIRKKIILIGIIVAWVVAMLGAFLMTVDNANGQTGGPFGGKSKTVFYCSCSMSILHTVGPPVGGQYIYQMGATRLYAYGQIFRAGPWLLGMAGGTSQCRFIIPTGCAVRAVAPVMVIVGTSL